MIYFYNIITPVLFLFIALIMILDGKKYLKSFNGGIGIFSGGLLGIKLGELIFNNIIGGLLFFIIFMIAGYYINKIKKIEYVIVSGLSWGLFAIIVFSVLKVQDGGLMFFGIFFFLSGAVFSYFYYSELLMISGYSFIGANIIFISSFYGLENVSKNMFEIFYYPHSFYKFFHLYRINFFFFIFLSLFFIVFSIYFQSIKNKEFLNGKSLVLNNVLNESGYIFAIFYFLTENSRIFVDSDSLFIFGISYLNWPIFTFMTYWTLGFIKKQEQVDLMIGNKKGYKTILYICAYSIVFIPILAFLTNFGKFSLTEFFDKDIWIALPKWIFTIMVLPVSIYLLYPKSRKKT